MYVQYMLAVHECVFLKFVLCITGTSVCGLKSPCLCPATWVWWSLSRAIRLCWEKTRRKPPDSPTTSVTGRSLTAPQCSINMNITHTHITLCPPLPVQWHSVSCAPLSRLMSIMKVTSAETEVVVAVKYFYLLACKPQEAWLLPALTATTKSWM